MVGAAQAATATSRLHRCRRRSCDVAIAACAAPTVAFVALDFRAMNDDNPSKTPHMGAASTRGDTAAPDQQIPYQQIRAVHDDTTIRVYQAYCDQIADAALAHGRFVAPFSRSRMTWIKPS